MPRHAPHWTNAKLPARKAADALEMTRERFQKGDSDRVDVLEAESTYAAADRARVGAAQESLEDYAALVKALGGGWSASGDALAGK
jgi:outer membrane protein TolC